MNNKTLLVIGAAICSLFTTLNCACAQSTLFTYQGMLNTNGAPYTGSAELQFTLWDAATNGNVIATNNPTSIIANVVNGLFTVTLDFGLSPFNGDPRFLQSDVRTAIGPFTTLAPRQPVTATPYALRALNLTTNGLVAGTYGNALTFNNAGNNFAGLFNGTFTGAYSGNGAAISNVNALTLSGIPASGFWATNGNTGANPTNGAFLGNADDLPLELRVNGHRALRLEPDSSGVFPNVILGSDGNSIGAGVFSSSIGGGEENSILLSPGQTQEKDSVIAGGDGNSIGTAALAGAVLFSGLNAIGGGHGNSIRARAAFSVISGGEGNTIATNSRYAAIPGGDQNSATNHAFAAGHRAKANHDGTFVWADASDVDFASTATNQFLIRASGGVGINTANPSRELEVQHTSDVEIGIKSTDTGGHLWTLQSSSVSGNANLDASFQTIDRTSGGARLLIGTNGFVGIGTSAPTNKLHVAGGITCTALVQTSDRNAKENFAPISPDEVLTKVAALPISTWTYKEMRDGRHLGPMAQDFYAAFRLGGSDTTITAIDTEGVALAAIQGLNQKLRQESEAKDTEIAELKARLEKLETVIHEIAGGAK
jgi:hypothetical protein